MSGKWYQKEVVYIDPDFEDLIPSFLESRRNEIGIIRECIVVSNLAEAQRLGHGMKGAGAGYGFPEISAIGAKIEEAAKSRDTAGMEEALDMLDEYLSVVEIRPGESD
ncbi:MAG: Hpt domain-containing protein [Deltaproteobacteria bacterium]